MRTERARRPVPVAARRALRLGLSTGLSLGVAYGMGLPLAFLAPVLAFMVGAAPGPPLGVKGLLGLIVVTALTTGIGLLMTPLLMQYAVPAMLLTALGLFVSNYTTVHHGKVLVGALLAVGFTLIPAAGTVSFPLAVIVIQNLVFALAIAIVCQWALYPFFPEDPGPRPPAPSPPGARGSAWTALRATLVVMPPFFVCLVNPQMYMPLIMKTVLLGQQATVVDTRDAGRELLGSTFLAGLFAIAFWFALKLAPTLWMFSLWMALFAVFFAAKLYRVVPTRYPASYWTNVAVTMLILVGPAVADSADGRDPYKAFAIRMALFVGVAVYAWTAVAALERWRARRARAVAPMSGAEVAGC